MPLPERTLVVAEFANQRERFRRGQFALADDCLFGWSFHTFDSLCRALAEGSKGGGRLLNATQQRELLRQARDRALPEEQRPKVWDTSGVLAQLGGIISELRRRDAAPVTPGAGFSVSSPNIDVVRAVWWHYEQLLDGRLDDAGVIRHALAVLRQLPDTASEDVPVALRGVTTVHIIGFRPETESDRDLAPWTQTFVQLLQAAFSGGTVLRHCLQPADEPALPDAFLAVLRDNGADGPAPEKPGALDFLQAPDVETELRVAARRLRRLLGRDSTDRADLGDPVDAERLLVVVPPDPAFEARLAAVLSDYAIPHDAVIARTGVHSPSGQLVLRALELDVDAPRWDQMLGLLASPAIIRSGLWSEERGLSLRQIARLLRRYGLRRGTWDEWREALALLINVNEKRRAQLAGSQDDRAAGSLERIDRRLAELKAAEPSFRELINGLRRRLDAPARQSVWQWRDWVRTFVGPDGFQTRKRGGMDRRSAAASADTETLTSLIERLSMITGAGELTRAEFTDLVQTELAALAATHTTNWTACVNVRTPEQVEQGDWDVVFVLGMNEGRLPWQTQDSGLLSDPCQAAAALDLPTAERANEAAVKALFQVLAAIPCHARVFVSFSATGADHRMCLASPLLQRLDDRLAEWVP